MLMPKFNLPTLGELLVIGVVAETLFVVGALTLFVWSLIGDFQGDPLQDQLRAYAGFLGAAAVVFPALLSMIGRSAR